MRPRVLAIALATLIAALFALHAFTALVVTPAAATGRIARAIAAHLEGVAP